MTTPDLDRLVALAAKMTHQGLNFDETVTVSTAIPTLVARVRELTSMVDTIAQNYSGQVEAAEARAEQAEQQMREKERVVGLDVQAEMAYLRQRAERAEATSEGRRKVLEEKAEELRLTWIRAEQAEAALAQAQQSLAAIFSAKDAERKGLDIATLTRALQQAEAKLADATAYCSGEFPCEASTAAAFLEREVGRLREALRGILGDCEQGAITRRDALDRIAALATDAEEMCHHQHPLGPPGRIIQSHPKSEPCSLRPDAEGEK
jgi:chromosome segregation ATPase